MISSLSTASPFLYVSPTTGSYVNNYSGQSGVGMVRFNTTTSHLEAFDGTNWIQIASHASISMTEEAVEAIQWTRNKINEEKKLKELAAKHPGVADAMDQLARASEQLEIMVQLVNQDNPPVA
jgi:flagellar hook-basal body complex protein FliE